MNLKSPSEKYLSRYRALLRFPNLIGLQGIYQTLSLNFDDLKKVIDEKVDYVATSVFAPSEILNALCIHYLPLEPVIATASQLGIVTDLEDIRSHVIVFDSSCCGGQSLLALYERGILPLPKCFLASSHMCDDSLKTYNFVSRYYDVPIFNLDIPYHPDDAAVDYVESQLEDMIVFICKRFHCTFDLIALKQAVCISNETNRYRQAISELCKSNPPLFKMSEFLPSYPLYTKFGRKEVAAIYAQLLEQVRQRVDGYGTDDETTCYRILWLGMIPLVYPHFLNHMESLKFGFPITELMFHSDFETMDENHPLRALAKKLLGYPLVGEAGRRMEKISDVIDAFGIEGVIHFNHRSCISFNGDNFLINELCKKKNIPFAVVEGDIADKKYCRIESIQESINSFSELLEARYGPR